MSNKPEKKTTSLLMNNKVLMIISLSLAFFIWLWIAIEKSPVETKVIQGVAVTINVENSVPSQLGLQVFSDSEYTVDVTVTGKKYVLESLKADDIVVTAQTNYVDSAGSKSLVLKAESKNSNADFEISNLSSNYIEVYFDTLSKKEFTIEPLVNTTLDNIVPDEFVLGSVVLSKSVVNISGPSSEVNSISGIKAAVTLDRQLSATETFIPEISVSGVSEKNHLTLDVKADELTLTVPVLKVVTLSTSITFKNVPTSYIGSPLSYTVYPSKLSVAIPVERVDTITTVSVATIDFASINKGYNTFTIKTQDISDYKIISDINSVKVVVNASNKNDSIFSIPKENISISNQKDGFTATLAQGNIESVTIIGSTEDLKKLSNSDIYAEIDLTDQTLAEGKNTVQATVVVKGDGACWGYGKYDVVVSVVKN